MCYLSAKTNLFVLKCRILNRYAPHPHALLGHSSKAKDPSSDSANIQCHRRQESALTVCTNWYQTTSIIFRYTAPSEQCRSRLKGRSQSVQRQQRYITLKYKGRPIVDELQNHSVDQPLPHSTRLIFLNCSHKHYDVCPPCLHRPRCPCQLCLSRISSSHCTILRDAFLLYFLLTLTSIFSTDDQQMRIRQSCLPLRSGRYSTRPSHY